MKKMLLLLLFALLLQPAFGSAAAAESKVEIYAEKGTLANLYEQNLLTKESYTRLLQENLDPETTLVEVSYSRNVDALVRHVKDSSSTSAKISDVTTPVVGDQQQTRWQREESGHLFNYLNTYQYFEDRNWIDVYFSKTYIKTTDSTEASAK